MHICDSIAVDYYGHKYLFASLRLHVAQGPGGIKHQSYRTVTYIQSTDLPAKIPTYLPCLGSWLVFVLVGGMMADNRPTCINTYQLFMLVGVWAGWRQSFTISSAPDSWKGTL